MKNYKSNIEKKIETAWEAYYNQLPETEVEVSWNRLRNHISNKSRRKKRQLYYKISSAAAVLLIVFTGYFFQKIYNPTFHVKNTSFVDKEIALPDGSLVLLKPNSELRYKERFENARAVDLTGEAFFNIVKDSLKVFKVKTSATTTTVLGTTFTVSEESNLKDTKISLYTGKVLISVKGKADSWTIVPGESFIYEQDKTSIEEFQTALSFAAGNEFVDINNIELEKLLKFLEDRFNYKFEKNTYTNNKRVTLRVNKSDSLRQILDILSIINNTNYEINPKTKKVQIFKK